jgi:hypothetical protein
MAISFLLCAIRKAPLSSVADHAHTRASPETVLWCPVSPEPYLPPMSRNVKGHHPMRTNPRTPYPSPPHMANLSISRVYCLKRSKNVNYLIFIPRYVIWYLPIPVGVEPRSGLDNRSYHPHAIRHRACLTTQLRSSRNVGVSLYRQRGSLDGLDESASSPHHHLAFGCSADAGICRTSRSPARQTGILNTLRGREAKPARVRCAVDAFQPARVRCAVDAFQHARVWFAVDTFRGWEAGYARVWFALDFGDGDGRSRRCS